MTVKASILANIRLLDMNDYDTQRVLRENVALLDQANDDTLHFVQNDGQLPSDVMLQMLRTVSNNAAEVTYLLAVSDNQADLNTYVEQSPLFRGVGGAQ